MAGSDKKAGSIVAGLKTKVSASLNASWVPTTKDPEDLAPMSGNSALAYLHRHWELASTVETPERHSLARPRLFVRAMYGRLLVSALSRYLTEEQEVVSHMVRLQDALAKRCDALHEEQVAAVDALRSDLIDLASRLEVTAAGQPRGKAAP